MSDYLQVLYFGGGGDACIDAMPFSRCFVIFLKDNIFWDKFTFIIRRLSLLDEGV